MSQPIIGRIEQLTFSSVPYNEKKPDDSRRDFFERQDEINRDLFKHFDEALKVIDHNFRTLSAQVAELQALHSATSNAVFVETSRIDREEFERLVKPLVDFLQTQCHPHMSVIVEWDRAALVEDQLSMPFKVPD